MVRKKVVTMVEESLTLSLGRRHRQFVADILSYFASPLTLSLLYDLSSPMYILTRSALVFPIMSMKCFRICHSSFLEYTMPESKLRSKSKLKNANTFPLSLKLVYGPSMLVFPSILASVNFEKACDDGMLSLKHPRRTRSEVNVGHNSI